MAVKIRLRRTGRKKAPMYRIVVADSHEPARRQVHRDHRPVPCRGRVTRPCNLDTERANHWLDVGAQPTDTVRSLLRKAGVLKARHEARLGEQAQAAAVPVARSKADERR